MASDSKCEQIVKYWVDKFEAGGDARIRRFTTVQRTGLDLTKLIHCPYLFLIKREDVLVGVMLFYHS